MCFLLAFGQFALFLVIGIYYAFGAHGVKGITPPKFWDSATGACTLTLAGHEGNVNSVVFSADGVSVLTASKYRTAKVWGSIMDACMLTLTGHEGVVNSAVFSADGVSVLTASKNCTAKVWDSTTGPCKLTLTGHDATLF